MNYASVTEQEHVMSLCFRSETALPNPALLFHSYLLLLPLPLPFPKPRFASPKFAFWVLEPLSATSGSRPGKFSDWERERVLRPARPADVAAEAPFGLGFSPPFDKGPADLPCAGVLALPPATTCFSSASRRGGVSTNFSLQLSHLCHRVLPDCQASYYDVLHESLRKARLGGALVHLSPCELFLVAETLHLRPTILGR